MVRPRWQKLKPSPEHKFWRRWNRFFALIAAANLSWLIFDISYIQLRNFWFHRKLYPFPSAPIVVPFRWVPKITPYYDQIKGIKVHQQANTYLKHFAQLDQELSIGELNSQATKDLLNKHILLTNSLIEKAPLVSSGDISNFQKIRSHLRERSGSNSYKEATVYLLSKPHLEKINWGVEREFWNNEILPLVASSYIRSIDENGHPMNVAWKVDLPFQLLFLTDILLRTIHLKYRFKRVSWRDAFLRRWIDLPLLLPFLRILRIFPVVERLSNAKLIQIEPIRAVISQGVVALLAIEIFEVITLRVIDSMQRIIGSQNLAQRIRNLSGYQSIEQKKESEANELIRLWIPLFLSQIGPNLRPQLVALFSHALQRSLEGAMIPDALKRLDVVEKTESAISLKLAEGMIEVFLDFSRNAGTQLGRKDIVLEKLGSETLDQFWEELAKALENKIVLEKSQSLLIALLENLKRSSFHQIQDQAGINELITELDNLNFSSTKRPPTDQA